MLAIKRGYNIKLLDDVVNHLAMQIQLEENIKTTNYQVILKAFVNAI